MISKRCMKDWFTERRMYIRRFLPPDDWDTSTIISWDTYPTMWKSTRTPPVLWNMHTMTGVSTGWQKSWNVPRKKSTCLPNVPWITRIFSIKNPSWCVVATKTVHSSLLSHRWNGEMPLQKEIAGIIPGLSSTIRKVLLTWWAGKRCLLPWWIPYLPYRPFLMTAITDR